MRTNLITHFHCSECGHILNVEYDKEDGPPKIEELDKELPTGAACRHNRILVVPCKHCINKVTGPARKLAEAIKEMGGSDA